jgi:hypothetical protein
MPSQRGFGDDGTKTTRFYRPDDSDDQMNEMTKISYIPASYQNLKKPWNSCRSCNSPRRGVGRRGTPFVFRGLP